MYNNWPHDYEIAAPTTAQSASSPTVERRRPSKRTPPALSPASPPPSAPVLDTARMQGGRSGSAEPDPGAPTTSDPPRPPLPGPRHARGDSEESVPQPSLTTSPVDSSESAGQPTRLRNVDEARHGASATASGATRTRQQGETELVEEVEYSSGSGARLTMRVPKNCTRLAGGPSALLVQMAHEHDVVITVSVRGGERLQASQTSRLLSLAVHEGQLVDVIVSGPGAAAAVEGLFDCLPSALLANTASEVSAKVDRTAFQPSRPRTPSATFEVVLPPAYEFRSEQTLRDLVDEAIFTRCAGEIHVGDRSASLRDLRQLRALALHPGDGLRVVVEGRNASEASTTLRWVLLRTLADSGSGPTRSLPGRRSTPAASRMRERLGESESG